MARKRSYLNSAAAVAAMIEFANLTSQQLLDLQRKTGSLREHARIQAELTRRSQKAKRDERDSARQRRSDSVGARHAQIVRAERQPDDLEGAEPWPCEDDAP